MITLKHTECDCCEHAAREFYRMRTMLCEARQLIGYWSDGKGLGADVIGRIDTALSDAPEPPAAVTADALVNEALTREGVGHAWAEVKAVLSVPSGPNEAKAAVEALHELQEEKEEYDASFELRWKADMRAIKRWQAAGEGRELTWPDHADLCVWLLEQIDAKDQQIAHMLETIRMGR